MTNLTRMLIPLIIALSACCAPGATQSQTAQETAFRAIIIETGRGSIVALARGKRIELEPSPLLGDLVRGERVYITGTLNAWGSVDVSDVRKL